MTSPDLRRAYVKARRDNLAHLTNERTRPRAHRAYGAEPTRHAAFAFELARVRLAFAKLEAAKLVRVVQEPDDCSHDDYVEPSRDAHPEARRAWRRLVDKLDRDGVWYFCSDFVDPATGRWEASEYGVGGFVGDLYDDAEFELKDAAVRGYQEALDAYHTEMAHELSERATYATAFSTYRPAAPDAEVTL